MVVVNSEYEWIYLHIVIYPKKKKNLSSNFYYLLIRIEHVYKKNKKLMIIHN